MGRTVTKNGMDHEFQRLHANIIPKVEEMWDVHERDDHCEVGASKRPNP